MGGELSLMSASGRGARFSVKIPIERSSETVKESVDASLTSVRGYAGSRQRLLIVDDDDHSIEILANLLKGVGFEIEMAHSGQEAEQILEKGQCFDAVITDQFMADGDGWRVLWVMHKRQPAVPVLLISAALPQEPIGWNHSVRFAATFLRPLKHTHLLQRLGDLLDLQWLFDVNPSSGLTGSLLRPGDDDIAELRQLVAFGEVTAIREWAQALRGREPRFASFADAVEEAVIEVDFGRLELLVVEA
jgi:CheY-like chemotaxis protein